jgi:hypothetical protein
MHFIGINSHSDTKSTSGVTFVKGLVINLPNF